MCKRTLMELPKLNKFEENPHLTEDFFGLLSRFIKYGSEIALSSSSLAIVLQLAEIGIGIQHIEAGKTVYIFLENLFILINEKGKVSSESMNVKLLLKKNMNSN